VDLISTNSGYDHSQNKITTTNYNSFSKTKNRAKSARLLKSDNKTRKIINENEKDTRIYETSTANAKNIKQLLADKSIPNEKASSEDFRENKSESSSNKINNIN